jgi:hypothetical protein
MKTSTGWRPEADGGDRPGGPDPAGSVDGCLWDVANIDEIDAKQRKATLAPAARRQD